MTKGNAEASALIQALAIEALTRRADAAFSVTKTEAQYEEQTAALRIELINKAIPEYLQGGEVKAKSLDGLTQEEKELVFKQVTAYRQADQRIANESHFLKKFNELYDDRLGNVKEAERAAKAYRDEMEAKIKQGIHLDADDFLRLPQG